MKAALLYCFVLALTACAIPQQPAYPDDVSGINWRKSIGAYRGP